MGYIYETTNLINNKKYIGLTNRKVLDETYLGSGKIILQAINKYGKKNFSVKVLEYVENDEDLPIRERYFIKKYDAVNSDKYYNISEGGQWGDVYSGMGETQYKEVSEKISKARKKWWEENPNKRKEYSERLTKQRAGVPLSKEEKEKISQGLKKYHKENPLIGKTWSEKAMKTRIKNGNLNPWIKHKHPWIGKEHTKETKQKISNSLKGVKRVYPCELYKDEKLIKEFESVKEMREYLKNELKWKKAKNYSLKENTNIDGYTYKRLGYKIIKPQTTIES